MAKRSHPATYADWLPALHMLSPKARNDIRALRFVPAVRCVTTPYLSRMRPSRSPSS